MLYDLGEESDVPLFIDTVSMHERVIGMHFFGKSKRVFSKAVAIMCALVMMAGVGVQPVFAVDELGDNTTEQGSTLSDTDKLVTDTSETDEEKGEDTTAVDESEVSVGNSGSSGQDETVDEDATIVEDSYFAPAGYDEDTRMGCTMDETEGEVVDDSKAATPRNGNYSGTPGIDVSHWNNNINWSAVRSAGYEFAFVKVSGTSIASFSLYQDSKFRQNLSGAAAAGLKVGAYHFSQALNTAEAAAEANYICDLLAGYSISMPVVIDYEWESSYRLADGGDYNNRTAVCAQFCETVRSRGYTPCIYANDSCCKNNINAAGLTATGANKLWVARYSSNFPSCSASVDYWQYSSKGSVPGIAGNVDMNWWYGTGMAPSAFPSSGSSKYNYMYRMYNPNSGEHFYTASKNEASNLTFAGWTYEGVGWNAPTGGNNVYRLYNPNAGDHHYTTSASERDWLTPKGWRYEGVGWRTGGSKPVYRAYNPNAVSGAHHFTTNKAEINKLVSVGWRYEGIGWYSY